MFEIQIIRTSVLDVEIKHRATSLKNGMVQRLLPIFRQTYLMSERCILPY